MSIKRNHFDNISIHCSFSHKAQEKRMYIGAACLVFASVLTTCASAGVFKRRGFSAVALPFKYHGIVPEFIDEAPKELLEVSILLIFIRSVHNCLIRLDFR